MPVTCSVLRKDMPLRATLSLDKGAIGELEDTERDMSFDEAWSPVLPCMLVMS